MIDKHPVLILTDRGLRHQQAALSAAPSVLDVAVLRKPSRQEVLRHLPEFEFLISERSGRIDAGMIAAGKNLRLIQRLGSLTYDIDLDAAQAACVPVCAWPVRTCVLVAEHVVMQMLVLTKRLAGVTAAALEAGKWGPPSRRTDEDTFAYNWSDQENIGGICGKTVGILGFGEIGAELARRLRGFAPAGVLYHKRHRLPQPAEVQLGLTYAARDRLLAQSDFLCNFLPYSPETDLSLDAGSLARMKPTSYLISCGSGAVIDEPSLAEALRAGRLAGAALDTYEWEPIRPENPLLPLARDPGMNVLLTPHTAAGTPLAGGIERKQDYDNILRLLRGEPLLHRVA